ALAFNESSTNESPTSSCKYFDHFSVTVEISFTATPTADSSTFPIVWSAIVSRSVKSIKRTSSDSFHCIKNSSSGYSPCLPTNNNYQDISLPSGRLRLKSVGPTTSYPNFLKRSASASKYSDRNAMRATPSSKSLSTTVFRKEYSSETFVNASLLKTPINST